MMRHHPRSLSRPRPDGLRAGPATPAAAQEARPDPLPGTKLSIDQLKAQMFHVSAGKRLKGAWPNGAKVAVGLSFDVDNATATLSTGNLDYEMLSRGEYGAVDGLPRILRVLDRQQMPASFFIPAASAVLHPQVIKDIQDAKQQHEIGVHGWIHERLPLLNDEKEEQRLLDAVDRHADEDDGQAADRLSRAVVETQRLDNGPGQSRGFPLRQQPDGERRCV